MELPGIYQSQNELGSERIGPVSLCKLEELFLPLPDGHLSLSLGSQASVSAEITLLLSPCGSS